VRVQCLTSVAEKTFLFSSTSYASDTPTDLASCGASELFGKREACEVRILSFKHLSFVLVPRMIKKKKQAYVRHA